jgi:membrane protease YdiL (CAAX protease family)
MRTPRRLCTRLAAGSLALAAVIAAHPAAAAPLPAPGTPDSHAAYVSRLNADHRRAADELLARYDAYLAAHPDDAIAAVERCRFLGAALFDPEREENPLQEQWEACLEELPERFPNAPAVTLYRLQDGPGFETARREAETLLAGELPTWSPQQVAALHALIVESTAFDKAEPDATVLTHGEAAMLLDPSLDYSHAIAQRLQRRDPARARALLGAHIDSDDDPYSLTSKVALLIALDDFPTAQRALQRQEALSGRPADPMQKGALLEGLGDLEAARAQYDEAEQAPYRRADARRKRLALDLRRADAGAAIASYESLRDLGYQYDPLLLSRLQVAHHFPSAPWQLRDVFGALSLAALLGGCALLPLAWILPLHYVELRRRARFAPAVATGGEWRLGHAWYAAAVMIAVQIGAGLVFSDVDGLMRTMRGEPGAAVADPPAASMAGMLLWGTALTAVGLLPLAWRTRWAWRGHWSVLRTLLLPVLTVVAVKLGFILYRVAAPGEPRPGQWLEDAVQQVGVDFGTPALLLTAVFVGPFVEELIFRGALLGSTARTLPFWVANLFQAVLFALVHAIPALIPYYLLFGLALGWLQRRSGGLLAPYVAHLVNNLFAVVILVARS